MVDEMYTKRVNGLVSKIEEISRKNSGSDLKPQDVDPLLVLEVRKVTEAVRSYGATIAKTSSGRYGMTEEGVLRLSSEIAKTVCVATGVHASKDKADERSQKIADLLLDGNLSEAFHLCASIGILVGMGIVDEMVFGPGENEV